jgi:hypothetical protein
VVIGVHTPEFSFEHSVELVRLATERHAIDYPVAIDNDYGIWDAFANRYWPALYFVDRDGVIRDEQFGEGRYEHSEMLIQRLLGVRRELVSVAAEGVEAEADWPHLRTPETYLGGGRGERFAPRSDAGELRLNQWTLEGEWSRGPERVVLDRAGGSIAFRFEARDAHAVLAAEGAPIPFQVSLDGEPPGLSHGGDTDEDGQGELREGRLYQLVRVRDDSVRARTLRIRFDDPGAQAYALTFG